LIIQGLCAVKPCDMVALVAQDFNHDLPKGVVVFYQGNV
jgi:hypothetical protein